MIKFVGQAFALVPIHLNQIMFTQDLSYYHSGHFIHHEDHEEHEETIRPSGTHFSCPSCVSW